MFCHVRMLLLLPQYSQSTQNSAKTLQFTFFLLMRLPVLEDGKVLLKN